MCVVLCPYVWESNVLCAVLSVCIALSSSLGTTRGSRLSNVKNRFECQQTFLFTRLKTVIDFCSCWVDNNKSYYTNRNVKTTPQRTEAKENRKPNLSFKSSGMLAGWSVGPCVHVFFIWFHNGELFSIDQFQLKYYR